MPPLTVRFSTTIVPCGRVQDGVDADTFIGSCELPERGFQVMCCVSSGTNLDIGRVWDGQWVHGQDPRVVDRVVHIRANVSI